MSAAYLTFSPVPSRYFDSLLVILFHFRQKISKAERTNQLDSLLSKAAAYSNFLQGAMPTKPSEIVDDEAEAPDEADAAVETPDTKKRKKGGKSVSVCVYSHPLL